MPSCVPSSSIFRGRPREDRLNHLNLCSLERGRLGGDLIEVCKQMNGLEEDVQRVGFDGKSQWVRVGRIQVQERQPRIGLRIESRMRGSGVSVMVA